jgi:hypothetical protein
LRRNPDAPLDPIYAGEGCGVIDGPPVGSESPPPTTGTVAPGVGGGSFGGRGGAGAGSSFWPVISSMIR